MPSEISDVAYQIITEKPEEQILNYVKYAELQSSCTSFYCFVFWRWIYYKQFTQLAVHNPAKVTVEKIYWWNQLVSFKVEAAPALS